MCCVLQQNKCLKCFEEVDRGQKQNWDNQKAVYNAYHLSLGHIYYALEIYLNQWTVEQVWKLEFHRLHLHILSWNWPHDSLRTDLVLQQVGEEFHRLRPTRLPSQGLTGSQERGLSFGVVPVDLSPPLHQQADQTQLTGGCCTDEGAAVGQGVSHGLEGKGKSDSMFKVQQQNMYTSCSVHIWLHFIILIIVSWL